MLPWNAIVLLTLALANGVFIMKWKGFEIMRHKNDHSGRAIENSVFFCTKWPAQWQSSTSQTALLSSIWDGGEGTVWNENENTIKVLRAFQTPWSMWWVNLDKEHYIRKPLLIMLYLKRSEKRALPHPPQAHQNQASKQSNRIFLDYSESKVSVMQLALISWFLRQRKWNVLILVK